MALNPNALIHQDRLVVKVVKADDLLPKDSNGFSDPYCSIQLGTQTAKTNTKIKTLHPRWDEDFEFVVEDKENDYLHIKIWDSDYIGKDFEGQVDVPLVDLVSNEKVDLTLDLQPRPNKSKDKVGGTLTLQLMFLSADHEDREFESGCYEQQKVGVDSFEILKVLGKGHYGKVLQVREKATGTIFAMKVIKKERLSAQDIEHTVAEKEITAHANHPYMIHLHYSFQTADKLYLVLDYVPGGEMFYHFQFTDHFTEERTQFYAAELILVISYLHSLGIIYRDLKPENILLDYDGHIRLADFGLCKMSVGDDDRTSTFCGTPEYLAPEQISNEDGYGKAVDWWALGVVLWEMVLGLPPFFVQGDTQKMYRAILKKELTFPDYPVTDEFKDFMQRMLCKDPNNRLGSGPDGVEEIKNHPWLASIDWDAFESKEVEPPYKPKLKSADDALVSRDIARMPAVDSPEDGSKISATLQDEFAGFTYNEKTDGAMADALGLDDSLDEKGDNRPPVDTDDED